MRELDVCGYMIFNITPVPNKRDHDMFYMSV